MLENKKQKKEGASAEMAGRASDSGSNKPGGIEGSFSQNQREIANNASASELRQMHSQVERSQAKQPDVSKLKEK